jgi:hypothetical protein
MIWDKTASEPERRAQLERAIDRHAGDFGPFTPREIALSSERSLRAADPAGREAHHGAGARRLRRDGQPHHPAGGRRFLRRH